MVCCVGRKQQWMDRDRTWGRGWDIEIEENLTYNHDQRVWCVVECSMVRRDVCSIRSCSFALNFERRLFS